jgi:hypothetical protein
MDEKENNKLDRLEDMLEENNEILHKLHRAEKLRQFGSLLYWLIVLGLAFGAYYFIQPYVDNLRGLYGEFRDRIGGAVDNVLPGSETKGDSQGE